MITYLPPVYTPMLVATPWDFESIGCEIVAMVGGAVGSAAPGSTNFAYYHPYFFQEPVTVTKVWWHNGATASGNIDCGVYDSDPVTLLPTTRLVAAGATAQGTINVVQSVDVTDTVITSGLKFLALHCTSATATFFRATPGTVNLMKTTGICQESVATALPATATPTIATSSLTPLYGVTLSPRTLAA